MPASSRFAISIVNEQSAHPVDEAGLTAAALLVLENSEYASAEISLAVVDDATIHQLNRQFLEHDYPTDVLSFALEDDGEHLQGEVILSAETAAVEAAEAGWSSGAEQLLYVVHGMLHLVGYRDKTPEESASMREAERRFLKELGHPMPRPA